MGRRRTKGELDSIKRDFEMMGYVMENDERALSYMILDRHVSSWPTEIITRIQNARAALAKIAEDIGCVKINGLEEKQELDGNEDEE